MDKIIGYCRTSTCNQKNEKTIEIQEQELINYAKTNKLELDKLSPQQADGVFP